MADLSSAIWGNQRAMRRAADDLYEIADALATLGLDRAASRLAGIAADLPMQAKAISDAYGTDLGEQVASSERMTGLLLGAVVSGAIGPRVTKGAKAHD